MMRRWHWKLFMYLCAAFIGVSVFGVANMYAQEDPYEKYIKTSRDFKRVKQDKDWCYKAWPSWTYMPWYYRWGIGFGDEGGKFSVENGYNGAFIDHGNPSRLDWINKWKLRFYVDHLAGKGNLKLRHKPKDVHKLLKQKVKDTGIRWDPRGDQARPVGPAMKSRLEALMSKRISNVKSSPNRAAYALDDEISWGTFVRPCMWQISEDKEAFENWLKEIYGKGNVPERSGWIGYDKVRKQLPKWSIGTFDASELMDQWSYNDSVWNNFLGDLVEFANKKDPATPCGFVGGQSPNAFGGFDYAKIMRKVQFIESYNLGGSQAVMRSFNPGNAISTVTTHFHKNSADTIWQAWYYAAHGNRGMIGWVEGWFDGKTPKSRHKETAPTFLALANKIGPLMTKAEWIHDGVALYYSHPSIQLNWILDAECHGGTWSHRGRDHALGTSHNARKAWQNMLRDGGAQYTFINYVDVIQKGIPKEYKVLILPTCFCLSNAEAERIRTFCKNGGTVIADFLPGCWDQHGKGYPNGGILDDMFGIKHDPNLKAGDIFSNRFWAETDQDKNYSFKTYEDLLTNGSNCIKDKSGFNKAIRNMEVNHVHKYGKGKAVLLNLSSQWYNAYRIKGFTPCQKRKIFMQHVNNAGCKRWVEIENAGEKEFGYTITYWNKNGRTILFLCFNAETKGSHLGGGNSVGLKKDLIDITLKFAKPISDVRNERTGKDLGRGSYFKLKWKQNEAIVLSFSGHPHK